ncbi:MAG: histidine--tRNA ligase [Candidatus Lambdaproteobacteria bacterium RIFOXYD2_FULL_50_16]|uniref:Histidine--tRNA ligase n=1 Tax=Candidatus Lambdaproteobacteria bacterium RIFOXYD2_FULL_50_16 TaxID=1817772 RepID=A0A1F6GD33_9PROT|nr:MAG: histidine--tRNA ligase [Candidatus Lambdaproteobacteria bacterium RIFOXYD2_FULL_50_16]
MSSKLQIVKGMRDLSGVEAKSFAHLEDTARQIFGLYGFEELRTPILEFTELFTKGIGQDTDIVGKEMYLVLDRREKSLALRPEGTASVVRHVASQGLMRQKKQVKFFYFGPMFRYERPQKGRFRQFYQIGVESFGNAGPDGDLELFLMLRQYFSAIGLKNVGFQLNSIGCPAPDCRPAFRAKLVGFLSAQKEALCPDCQRRLETNPLRVLDCKNERCIQLTQDAPKSIDSLCGSCKGHHQELLGLLEAHQISYETNNRLVRGLDYYSKTVFEVYSADLGAQSAAGGGGRFDGLFEQFGEEPVPSVGFALGLDRLVMLCPEPPKGQAPVFVIGWEQKAVSLMVAQLREAGIGAEYDPGRASMKSQFKQADRFGGRWTLVLGEEEIRTGQVTLKNMQQGTQTTLSPNEALKLIRA